MPEQNETVYGVMDSILAGKRIAEIDQQRKKLGNEMMAALAQEDLVSAAEILNEITALCDEKHSILHPEDQVHRGGDGLA